MNKLFGTLIAIAFLILSAGTPAQAALVSFVFDKASEDPFKLGNDKTINDCSGYFGSGFEECMIAYGKTDISPVIIKFNVEGEGETEINNSLFPSVDGTEWRGSGNDDEDFSSGAWIYSPGEGDPDVRYWAAKAAAGFILYWDVDKNELASLCETVNSLQCLLAANPVTSGTWDTGAGLSHLTFYDSKPSLVPVPTAFWLFGTALIGFIGISRRIKI